MPSPVYLQRIDPQTTTSSSTTSSYTTATNTSSQKLQLQPTTGYINPITTWMPENLLHHHTHPVGPNQCCSAIIQTITASIEVVWSFLSRFDNPQAYKPFLKSCCVVFGDGGVGSLREVEVISGLPAGSSTERLEILDDESHVMSFIVVGGDHRLKNYRSVTTLHRTRDGNDTVVVESYVVDVPQGNTKEETIVFVDTIVQCNLQSLAQSAETRSKTKTKSTIP